MAGLDFSSDLIVFSNICTLYNIIYSNILIVQRNLAFSFTAPSSGLALSEVLEELQY